MGADWCKCRGCRQPCGPTNSVGPSPVQEQALKVLTRCACTQACRKLEGLKTPIEKPFACAGAGDSELSEEDHADLLGEWDDADEDMYKARLEQWRARRTRVVAADVAPGQAPGAAAPAAGGNTGAAACMHACST